jgi:hypothetical protein
MECVCCQSKEKAVLTDSQCAASHPFIADDVDEALGKPPVIDHRCRVCGYRWQELRYPGPRGTTRVHDLPSSIPGQPAYRSGNYGLLATRETPDTRDDDFFKVHFGQYELTREQISQDQFKKELRTRQRVRRATICN